MARCLNNTIYRNIYISTEIKCRLLIDNYKNINDLNGYKNWHFYKAGVTGNGGDEHVKKNNDKQTKRCNKKRRDREKAQRGENKWMASET